MQEMSAVERQKRRDEKEAEDVKKTLAFTIDFGSGRDINTQRHKSILERFEQQRHKRGQSLSKLEESKLERHTSPSPTVTPNKPPLSGKLPRKKVINHSDSSFSSEQEDPKTQVQVRMRDRSTSQLRDSSKRHSWSPRSSMHEPNVRPNPKFVPKSSALTGALDGKSFPSLESSSNDPQSLDSFLCPEPPLENFKTDEEAVSEAGTYTVEGDNYTEEQKAKMNIDKLGVIFEPASPKPCRPTRFEADLEIIELDRPTKMLPARKSNVLELSCCHETTTVKPKVSYLDKLKSRVKNIGDRGRKSASPLLPSPDIGTFTSVTVSGVLSVKPCLERAPLQRRNSLTKATVDKSEYVQGKVNVDTSTNPSDSPKTSTDDESPVADKSTDALKTVSTKKDWIQEWARNAREFSSKQTSTATTGAAAPMTRSYDFENSHVARRNLNISDFEYSSDPNLRFREYQNIRKRQQLNYSSDHGMSKEYGGLMLSPSKTARNAMLYGGAAADDTAESEESANYGLLNKPPPSPSKIPSPIHTLGRARSVSRNRSVHGSMTVGIFSTYFIRPNC